MSQQNSGQMIQPTNALKLKLGGGRLGAIDPAAIARAEAALKSLSSNFTQWLADEITKLDAAREQVRYWASRREHGKPLPPRPRPQGPWHDLRLSADHPHRGLAMPMIDDKEKRARRPGTCRRPHRRDQGCNPRRHQIGRAPCRPRPGGRTRAPRRGNGDHPTIWDCSPFSSSPPMRDTTISSYS